VKNEVDVALVVVEFSPVKFWRVVDPVARRVERMVAPLKVLVLLKVLAV
jgi:hypothetical protein